MLEPVLLCLESINDALWSYIVVVLLVACAIYFTIRLRAVQFTMIPEMFRLLVNSTRKHGAADKSKSVNSFQAFAVSLSSRVGTGNLAGVASAIFIGGPGAVFWMWVMAFLGAATAFVESTLAQLYKKHGEDAFYGGPAYYMLMGLHRRWMAVLFAILITVTFAIANQIVQSNTICDALSDTSTFIAAGSFEITKFHVSIVLTIFTMLIVFGGTQRISRFSSIVVPIMAVGYILLTIWILLTNFMAIPSVFLLIVKSAFGFDQAVGGMFGVAVLQGVKRGLFSNEAGEGSAPNAAAIADISHPVKQGLLQSLGVFSDTLIICSCTAFIILVSGLYTSGSDGIILTTQSIEHVVGPVGRYFITVAVFLFAFSTIVANYFYGEANVRFVSDRRSSLLALRVVTGVAVLLGGLLSLQTVWCLVDICMGLMTICNLVAIVQLSPLTVKLLRDYKRQRREGRDPVFHRSMLPEEADLECWD